MSAQEQSASSGESIKPNLRKAYTTILGDNFPPSMTISFSRPSGYTQDLVYEKVGWDIDGEVKGMRYGDNPGQEAALFRLVNGNLTLGEVKTILPGRYLMSDVELLQSGKHPGKTNITDADNALNIMRYFTIGEFANRPMCAIMKHNNPCGVAVGTSLADAYDKADLADRIAAFGGTAVFNQAMDLTTAQEVSRRYLEVVVAPSFEEGTLDIFAKNKNLRVMQVQNIDQLSSFVGVPFLNFKSLIDGGVFVETSFDPKVRSKEDFVLGYGSYPKSHSKSGETVTITRAPSEEEYADMLFGWFVEAGISSNSVIYVKDLQTVGIGTGEQDRVGVAKIARDKAYEKLTDRYCYQQFGVALDELKLLITHKGIGQSSEYSPALQALCNKSVVDLRDMVSGLEHAVTAVRGGLLRATTISDAFYPFRDGVDVSLHEGIRAIVQPGGSINDYQAVEACNERNATMVYTMQRAFRH